MSNGSSSVTTVSTTKRSMQNSRWLDLKVFERLLSESYLRRKHSSLEADAILTAPTTQ